MICAFSSVAAMLSVFTVTTAVGAPPRPMVYDFADSSLSGPPQSPASCEIVYDANEGTEVANNAIVCCEILRIDGMIWDLLVAEDFETASAGYITDAYLYLYMDLHYGIGSPADGARIYLWGTGESPTEEPTQVWDIPAEQVRFWSLGWWEPNGYEIQVTGLRIPYQAGRNWITIQPRDLTGDVGPYYLLRDETFPLHGADSYVKDGPNNEAPGFGFTDWRTAGSTGYGFGVADSFIRLETCDGPGTLNISLAGQCGGAVTFSWENAPPNKTMNVIYARETGEFRLGFTHGCPTTLLGLGRQGIREAFRVETGAGSGSVHGRLRASACPGYFQAVIGGAGPCQVSNVIGTP